jgi:hypothetical protein
MRTGSDISEQSTDLSLDSQSNVCVTREATQVFLHQVQFPTVVAKGSTADTAREVTGPQWSATWPGCPVNVLRKTLQGVGSIHNTRTVDV